MELTQTTVAKFDSMTMATRVNNFKKTAKKILKATWRFLIVISPAYPQYVESQKRMA